MPTLPNGPGVYRMLDAKGDVLYVGKAKSLKKRLPAYAKPSALSARLQRMVALTDGVEVVTTASDVEALLLECNMIKRHRPPFNIVLRDDKSFPYIYVGKTCDEQPFPRIGRHRGAKRKDCDYFGPFASSGAVNETLAALLRAFPVRSCPDSIFHNRTRPCLQYQIKRCTAPCVGRIGQADYAQLLEQTRAFLAGRSDAIQDQLKAAMADASERLEFEQAAAIRDRLKALAHITSRQGINVSTVDDADVIALAQDGGQACVQVFFYRAGRNYGNRAYYPSHVHDAEAPELLDAFLGQFYAERSPPKLILVSHSPASQQLLTEALAVRAGRRVTLLRPQRGRKAPTGPAGGTERPPCAGAQARREQRPGQAPGSARRPARPAGNARPHRGLRQQPHHGHGCARRVHRRRTRGLDQVGLSAVSDPEQGSRAR